MQDDSNAHSANTLPKPKSMCHFRNDPEWRCARQAQLDELVRTLGGCQIFRHRYTLGRWGEILVEYLDA